MAVIIDASVTLKWFLPENGSDRAHRLLSSRADLVAPDLLIHEVCNVLWLKVERGHVPLSDAQAIARRLPDYFIQIIPGRRLAEAAVKIAATLHHPVYDCLYVAAAEALDADLVTADQGLIKAVRDSVWAPRVKDLIAFPT